VAPASPGGEAGAGIYRFAACDELVVPAIPATLLLVSALIAAAPKLIVVVDLADAQLREWANGCAHREFLSS
jgi:hypothetical protein